MKELSKERMIEMEDSAVCGIVVGRPMCDEVGMGRGFSGRESASFVALLAFSIAAACAPPGPDVVSYSTRRPLSGPCPLDGSATVEFTSEVESLRLTVTAPDM